MDDVPATKNGAIGCAVEAGQLLENGDRSTLTSRGARADRRDCTVEAGEFFAEQRHLCGVFVVKEVGGRLMVDAVVGKSRCEACFLLRSRFELTRYPTPLLSAVRPGSAPTSAAIHSW